MQFILGKVFHDDGTVSDKDTLSYSGYSLWLASKDSYRKRYYENAASFENVETIFGKNKHRELDENSEKREKKIKVELKCGLKLMGYLDEFDEETLSIHDDKFSHRDAKGKAPWSKLKVAKHKQLVFYSLLVRKKYGKFNPIATLRWHETTFKTKSVTFDNHVMESQTRELGLTGHVEDFKRRVYKWEVEKLEKDIIKIAKEIHKDYEQTRNK